MSRHRSPTAIACTVTGSHVFDDIRNAFRELLRGNPSADARRGILADMRETLVRARMGVDDLRQGVGETKRRLEAQRRELETVQRRKSLAEGINDAETVRVATRFESVQTEKVTILERKLENQEAELELVEREVQEMMSELKAAAAGAVPPPLPHERAAKEAEAEVADLTGDRALNEEMERMARAQRRADSAAEADEKLAALKRRMGK
ncbi:MAG TPA: hypothetical protein VFG84_10415 [Gemmatimonadaceae bacterium]|nr:hypothetical protein [Gemmatimonadaceae bacterium]